MRRSRTSGLSPSRKTRPRGSGIFDDAQAFAQREWARIPAAIRAALPALAAAAATGALAYNLGPKAAAAFSAAARPLISRRTGLEAIVPRPGVHESPAATRFIKAAAAPYSPPPRATMPAYPSRFRIVRKGKAVGGAGFAGW
jgi:hypothetical protein